MISVNHKIYLTKKQESFLDSCLWSSIGIENWCISQIKHELDENYFPLRFMKPLQIRSVLSKKIKGHSKSAGLPSRLINDCIAAVVETVKRHGINKTHFKQARKKKSFFFNGDIKIDKKGRLKVPGMKTTFKISEMNKFQGNLKKATLIKKFNSWFACCVYDEQRKPIVCADAKEAGIDPGLKTSLTFSDSTQIDFPKFFKEQGERLAKMQRKSKNSKKHKLLARKVANKRTDHHHKLSTKLATQYKKIFWSNDSFKQLAKHFGKQYSELALGKFRDLLASKLASRADGLGELVHVTNKYSTQTCSACGTRSGPKGWDGLEVREWTCKCCGCTHDRDVNAAINTLFSGKGIASDLGKFVSRKSNSICGMKPQVELVANCA